MKLQELLNKFNTQMNNPGTDNATLTDWANEFINYISYDCNALTIKSLDYTVTDINTPGILPTDFWAIVKWYLGNIEYRSIWVREDGKIIFPYTGTYTLIYTARPTPANTSSSDAELPVDPAFHDLFVGYLKGKFYMDDGEGDETTGYGNSLVSTAMMEASRIAANKNNTVPVVPKVPRTIYRNEVDTDE